MSVVRRNVIATPGGRLAAPRTRTVSRFAVAAAAAAAMVLSTHAVRAQEGGSAKPGIVGSWKVISYEVEFQDGGAAQRPLGDRPNGYLLFNADGRMTAYLEAGGRKGAHTDEERAAAFKSLMAYTGKYRVEGDTWTTMVDGAWNAEWVGTAQKRFFTLEGNRLSVVAQWNKNPLYGGRLTRGRLTFEREK
jgi:Lipocalin-like domain